MQPKVLSFILKLFLLTVVTGAVIYSFKDKIPAQFVYEPFIGLLAFFFIVTLLLHMGYEKSFAKGNKYFVRFFMMASGIKLFGFMTILLLFAFLNKEHIVGFSIHFLFLYFVYTAFELTISFKKFGANTSSIQQ